jgi:hypothetical protein
MRLRISIALTAAVTALLVTIGAGCASNSSESVPTGAELIGTWKQTGAGYGNGEPVIWAEQLVVIEAADGQGFAGFKEYTPKGEAPQREMVNGVIAPNGDILITDEDGFFRGRLEDETILGQYAEVGDDSSAINLELKRK